MLLAIELGINDAVCASTGAQGRGSGATEAPLPSRRGAGEVSTLRRAIESMRLVFTVHGLTERSGSARQGWEAPATKVTSSR